MVTRDYNLLKFVDIVLSLTYISWYILENVLHALEKNVCSAALNGYICEVHLNYNAGHICFPIDFLVVLLYISPLRFLYISFIYLDAQLWVFLYYNYYIFLMNWYLCHYIMTFFLFFHSFELKVHFVLFEYRHLCSFDYYLHEISFLFSTYLCL